MTLNATADQDLILAKLQTLPQNVVETVDDIQEMPRNSNGTLKPLVMVDFGPATAVATQRTLAGEEAQMQDSYFLVIVYAATKQIVRQIMGILMEPEFLVGWRPSENTNYLTAGGGISAAIIDETRPTIHYATQSFRFAYNAALQSS